MLSSIKRKPCLLGKWRCYGQVRYGIFLSETIQNFCEEVWDFCENAFHFFHLLRYSILKKILNYQYVTKVKYPAAELRGIKIQNLIAPVADT